MLLVIWVKLRSIYKSNEDSEQNKIGVISLFGLFNKFCINRMNKIKSNIRNIYSLIIN